MIDLYYRPTPNGQKITMFLQAAAMDDRIHPVAIGAGAPCSSRRSLIEEGNKTLFGKTAPKLPKR